MALTRSLKQEMQYQRKTILADRKALKESIKNKDQESTTIYKELIHHSLRIMHEIESYGR